ncbi:hypothetical protein D3C80_1573060 [compost metagenome]
MQFPFALCHGQFIIRAGKVVHADKLIAGLGQRGDGLLQDIQFLLRAGQIRIFDFALGCKQVRHVGVVKYAEAIRVEFRHPLQGVSKALRRLLWQPVDQINIGGVKAQSLGASDQSEDKGFILLTVHQPLHFFIEILHPHAQAIKAFAA